MASCVLTADGVIETLAATVDNYKQAESPHQQAGNATMNAPVHRCEYHENFLRTSSNVFSEGYMSICTTCHHVDAATPCEGTL